MNDIYCTRRMHNRDNANEYKGTIWIDRKKTGNPFTLRVQWVRLRLGAVGELLKYFRHINCNKEMFKSGFRHLKLSEGKRRVRPWHIHRPIGKLENPFKTRGRYHFIKWPAALRTLNDKDYDSQNWGLCSSLGSYFQAL